jgi:colanic acid/amylovoran biosynthesis glycosyltransferase
VRVTFCSHDSPDSLGGPFAWIQWLLPELRDQGIDAHCLFLTWGVDGPCVRALRTSGFNCPSIPCHDLTTDRVKWILARLREDPPDVFVPNIVVAGYFASRWLTESGIPTAGVLHSDDPLHRGLQDAFVFGHKPFRLSGLVCVSKALEKEVLDRGPEDTTVSRIACGPAVPRAIVKRVPSMLRLAYVGRLAQEQKRITEVARAFCRATRELPGVEASIFGDGPERGAVESILTSDGSGLPMNLEGPIDSAKIQERLLECDVIVLLSDYEGLPIALMEGMACGCVPVCLRTRSGIPELVEDNVTGILVNDRGDGFINAIRRLRDEPGLGQRLSTAARAKIKDGYSSGTCAKQWAEFLNLLHSQSGPKRPIKIPRRITLPPTHPGFAHQDPRPSGPPLPIRMYRRTRMAAGRWRRMLMAEKLFTDNEH